MSAKDAMKAMMGIILPTVLNLTLQIATMMLACVHSHMLCTDGLMGSTRDLTEDVKKATRKDYDDPSLDKYHLCGCSPSYSQLNSRRRMIDAMMFSASAQNAQEEP